MDPLHVCVDKCPPTPPLDPNYPRDIFQWDFSIFSKISFLIFLDKTIVIPKNVGLSKNLIDRAENYPQDIFSGLTAQSKAYDANIIEGHLKNDALSPSSIQPVCGLPSSHIWLCVCMCRGINMR